MNRAFRSILAVGFLTFSFLTEPTATAGNVVFSEDFTSFSTTDNPWSGVNSLGQITGIPGTQLVVSDDGNIHGATLGPSVAVGDLNGDGLPDLVIADSMGFFWFFANHGTKEKPQFTQGELMPLWFGDPCPDIWHQEGLVTTSVVPRIQLIDFDGDGKLDLVMGNYLGKLFYLRNQGSTTGPVFRMPQNLDDITVPTRGRGQLWCNYLAPFLHDWSGNGHLDLLIGDGTYAANSIYFLTNKGTNDQPTFAEETTTKLIPGMGREHLVPQVVSWNGDGKADILSTEREGYVNIFLNQGDNPTGLPTFDQGRHISVGGLEKLPERSTVILSDLTNSKLPGLIVGGTDGAISYSPNIGKPNDFQFGPLVPLAGVNIRPKIQRPSGWVLNGAYGSPYDLLVCTDSKVEPGFTPPAAGISTALRFYIDEPAVPNPTFPEHFYPASDTRIFGRAQPFPLAASKRYKLSFWIRSQGTISDLKYKVWGTQNLDGNNQTLINIEEGLSASSSWNYFTTTIDFQSRTDDRHAVVNFLFDLLFNGKGSLYIAAVKMEEDD